MIDETQALGPQEQSLDDVLAECIAAEETGRALDRSALVARYPHHAAELREFFANRDRMQRLAGPLRGGGNGHAHVGTKLRYFGDYELLEEVAVGGMGIVYRARQVSLNRIVAVKMILKGTLASEDDVKRFRAEAEAAANLQHPGIVAIHEVGLHEGQHYFSMDFVDGQSLAQLPREQPLPASQAAEYVRDAAEAVHFAHQQGTLHRDLKPSNILIDRQNRVRITDFGLAKRIEGQSDLTLSGQILGTPSYMPPEQALSKRSLIGTASDVYSLGAVLYELLAGRPPFRGESPVETLRQVESLDPISPRLLSPTTPSDLETICLKCLEKEPHKRYLTAQYLADDLGRFLRHEPILARPISRLARSWRWCRRHPTVAALTAITAVSLLIGATVSTLFGIEANVRAAGERSERLRANTREAEAVAARARAKAREAESVAAKARAQELKVLAEQRANDLGQANQTLKSQSDQLGQQASELRTRQVSLYRSLLKLAHAQAQGNEIALADENLNQFPPEFRGWAWRYAKRLCHPEFLRVAGSQCVDFAPSGDAAATANGTDITVYATPGGEQLAALRGHSAAVTAVSFLGSRALLASASTDGTVRIWDVAAGTQLKQHHCGSACRDLAVAPDGRHLAIACDDGKTRIWDHDADRVEHELAQSKGKAVAVAYSPDGARLATGSDQKPGLQLWDAATGLEDPRSQSGALVKSFINFVVAVEGVAQAGIRDLAFSPNGTTLAIAQGDSLSLLDLSSLDVRLNLSGHFGGVLGTAFSADGRRVASASSDGNVRIWDTVDGRCLRTLPWHSGAVNAARFSAKQPWLASVDNQSLRVWDLSSDWDVRRLVHHTDAAYSVAFDAAGKLLATGGGRNAGVGLGPLDGEVRIVNVETGRLVFSATVPETVTATSARTPAVLSVALSPDGTRVAAAGRSLHVHVFDVATGGRLLQIENIGGQIGALAYHPNGQILMAAGKVRARTQVPTAPAGAGAVFLNAQTGQLLHFFPGPEYALFGAGGRIMFGIGQGSLSAWDVDSKRQLFNASLRASGGAATNASNAWRIALSPDQRLIALALDTRQLPLTSKQESIQLRDAQTGALVRTLTSSIKRDYSANDYVTSVYGVAFTPDGRELASASGDKTVRIWDVATGDELLVFAMPHQTFDVAFSSDGRRLAAASGHWSGPRPGEVRLWDALPTSATLDR